MGHGQSCGHCKVPQPSAPGELGLTGGNEERNGIGFHQSGNSATGADLRRWRFGMLSALKSDNHGNRGAGPQALSASPLP